MQLTPCVFQCRLFTSILFLKMYLFFVTLFICVHIDKHFCVYFFNYSSFLFLLFCCFFIFLHENLHPGQGEPNSRTLPPCPKEKLSTLLFSNFFQFGESFTEVKDWRIFHWWKWKIGRPKTQGGVLFKEGRSEVLPKGLHRRAQTLPQADKCCQLPI